MKRIFATAALLSTICFAGLSSAAEYEYGLTKHAIYGAVGFWEGGFALGADYENTTNRAFGIGGYVRMYQKDDKAPNTAPGVTTFGAFVRPHFTKKDWDLYVSPGFAIIVIDSLGTNPGDTTTMGPSLALGLMYELNGSVSLGVENMATHVWMNDDWRGKRVDDLMFRFRVAF